MGEGSQLGYVSSTLTAEGNRGVKTFSNAEKAESISSYTLNVSAIKTEGSINQSLNQLEYIKGTDVVLTATAAQEYK